MTSDPAAGSFGEALSRVELLVGPGGLEALGRAGVIVFGLGGVGSWCAEALARTGVGRITLVDDDRVALSNLNRQLMALHSTVGEPKAAVLRRRLLDIAPQADIRALESRYTAATAPSFAIGDYDYVIDAIDSIADKLHLVTTAAALPRTRLFSSMGAACRLDPSRVRTADFWQVSGDRLAAAMRQRLRRQGLRPRFTCVYSDEPLRRAVPAPVNGAVCHVTAVFGMTLASLVINDILAKATPRQPAANG